MMSESNTEKKIISVKLGSEWVIEDFIACLAETAEKDAKPIWIDQLCIEQNDQAIRKVLADIPSIYRSFDVTVLMPGRPCRCLPRIVREVNGLPPDPEDPYRISRTDECLNATGFNHQDALEEILIYFDDLEKEGRSDLVRYAHNPNHTDPLYRFLDGETLENQAQGLEKKNVYAFVLHVLEEYGSAYLWTPNRQASKPRDYVVSIWTDWDKYVIPHNYNTMEASSLMQDAIDQMFDKEGLVFGSTAPQGLFSGDLAGSAIWKPSEYLTKVESSGVVDYYRTIAAEIHVIPVLRDKSVPLDGHALIDELLGRHAETALQASGRINRSELSPGDDTSQEASVISAFTRMFHGLVDNWSEDRQPEGNGEPSQSKMEKLHSTMGLLVKLIFSASEHPSGRTKRVGLCRRDVDVLKIASGKTDVLTVKMFSGEHPPMLFEVERVGSRSNTPEYRVFGVWVPLEFEANDMKDFGMAVLHPSENREKYDAVLV
ncbi:Het-domain-containing protein [Lasiodiplodia theobromae]|uniref:Het-domain-containing protein n=1 Tax=Lasiodiplodia theobromae TaxID=45133 RepID=UPI0015C36BE0|nr:Het-domain-containing protein [Lasiodiplodia theobromae]KAF4541910.1 Het-domain-containing protein [Lasiodiplodia theobromae]